jgi:hypothetical protein
VFLGVRPEGEERKTRADFLFFIFYFLFSIFSICYCLICHSNVGNSPLNDSFFNKQMKNRK